MEARKGADRIRYGSSWLLHNNGVKDVGNVVRVRVELVEQSLDVLKEVQDEF